MNNKYFGWLFVYGLGGENFTGNKFYHMGAQQYFTDANLLDMLRVNNVQALRELVNRYWHPVYHYALEKTTDHTKAVEISSDLFKDLWDQRLSIPADFCLQSYLSIRLRTAVANGMYELLTRNNIEAGSPVHTMNRDYRYTEGFTFRKLFTAIKQTFAA
jgi:hypothetical protein